MQREREKDKEEPKDVSFDMYMLNKEKRRVSRSKGKRDHVKGKMSNRVDKPRTSKITNFDYDEDNDSD